MHDKIKNKTDDFRESCNCTYVAVVLCSQCCQVYEVVLLRIHRLTDFCQPMSALG